MVKLKNFLIILLIILLTCMGGVYAADSNQTADDSVSINDDAAAVDVTAVNEDSADDAVAVETDRSDKDNFLNLTNVSDEDVLINESNDENNIVNMDSQSDDVLGVSNENEVLGIEVSGSFANLALVIHNSDQDVFFSGDVRANVGGSTDVEIRRSNFGIYGNNYVLTPYALTHVGTSANRAFSIHPECMILNLTILSLKTETMKVQQYISIPIVPISHL